MAKRNRNLRLAEEILNRILDKQGPQGGLWILRSGNQLVDHFAVDIRQPEVPARVRPTYSTARSDRKGLTRTASVETVFVVRADQPFPNLDR